jgi:hypothetical protein
MQSISEKFIGIVWISLLTFLFVSSLFGYNFYKYIPYDPEWIIK